MDANCIKLQVILQDRGAWRAAVHGVSKGQTRLSNWTATTNFAQLLYLFEPWFSKLQNADNRTLPGNQLQGWTRSGLQAHGSLAPTPSCQKFSHRAHLKAMSSGRAPCPLRLHKPLWGGWCFLNEGLSSWINYKLLWGWEGLRGLLISSLFQTTICQKLIPYSHSLHLWGLKR